MLHSTPSLFYGFVLLQHIPLSSINHKFEPIAQRKDRLIVYNKTDLAHPDTEAVSRKHPFSLTENQLFFLLVP